MLKETGTYSLNRRKNVLSCVYRSYHLPFRAHRNTWKTITIANTIYKMHVAIFHVRKYERHFSTLRTYQTLRHHSEYCMTFKGNAGICISHARFSSTLLPRTELDKTASYRSWTQRMSTIFNCSYLPNRSTLDIGVLGFFGIV